MEQSLIKELLSELDIETIMKDVIPDFSFKKSKVVNIECFFAETKHKNGHDKNPSMSINRKGEVYCHSCGYKATNIIWLFKDLLKLKTFEEATEYIIDRYIEPLVDSVDILSSHKKLLRDSLTTYRLETMRGLSLATIKKYKIGLYNNQITIPILNKYGYYCNIRLYNMFHTGEGPKVVSFKKGFGSAKLYPYIAKDIGNKIYVFEGEMDCLLARQLGINGITITSGGNTWKPEFDEVFKGKHVILVPDIDETGIKGCEKRVEALKYVASKISVVYLPLEDSKHKDFSDYIVKEKHSIKEFLKLPEESFEAVKSTTETKKKEIVDLRKTNSEIAYVDNAEYVYNMFLNMGNFYKDEKQQLFFTKHDGGTFPITKVNQNFLSELVNINPIINPSTTNGKFIISHIRNKAFFSAESVTSSSWTLFKENVLYILLDKSTDDILRISKEEIKIIKNGVNEDNVLLEVPDNITPIEYDKDLISVTKAFENIQKNILNNIAMSEEYKLLFLCWVFSLFFRSSIDSKPLVRLEASTAYGKSTVSKIISQLIYGQEFLQHASTAAAIYTTAAKYPLLIFDNIETHNMSYDFEDFLLIAATGGSRVKRQLHTDTGFITEKVDCLVLNNGIEPFSKNETLSRTMVFDVDVKKYGVNNFQINKILYNINNIRNKTLISILNYLTTYIVKHKKNIYKYSAQLGSHSKDRFNEFFGLIQVLLDAIWPYINIKSHTPKSFLNLMLDKQTSADAQQSVAVNNVVYYFDSLALKHKGIMNIECKITQDNDCIKIRGQLKHLLSDFRIIAKTLGIKCPWENEKHLGNRIKDSKNVLKSAEWYQKILVSGGKRYYVFEKDKTSFETQIKKNKSKKQKGGDSRKL